MIDFTSPDFIIGLCAGIIIGVLLGHFSRSGENESDDR